MFHKRLLKEFSGNIKQVIGMVLTQLIMLYANVFLMIQTAGFIELVVKDGQNQEAIKDKAGILILALLVAIIIRCVMSYINNKFSFQASKLVKTRLRTLIYDKLMVLGVDYKNHFQTSEVVQVSTEGVEQLEIYFGKYVPQFFYSMLAPLSLFFIVGTMSWKVAIVLLICVPLIPVSIIMVQKFAKKMLAKYWGTYTHMGDSFLECLQGLTTLKIYQADERYAKKMDEEAEQFRKVTMRVLIMQLNSISIMDLIAYGGAAIGVILSIIEYQNAHITLAQCFFIIMISSEFFLPMRLLGSFFHIAMNGNAAADKIFQLLDLPTNNQTIDGNHPLTKVDSIELKNVDFSYEKDKQTLHNISIEAQKGLTALVGESGCGKSTIASLLMGDIKPGNGSIRLGDQLSSQINRDIINQSITRISHDSYLFAGTIRENLHMGNPSATEEDMYEALKKVRLLEFVKSSGGLDFELKEKASNLSGGQKQRLAIARAILHDTPVYIFDEATSNVDVEGENAIMEAVHFLAKDKIVILISHRLANVVNADQIFVLKSGAIVQEGNHEELMKQKDFYQELYMKQYHLETLGKEGLGL